MNTIRNTILAFALSLAASCGPAATTASTTTPATAPAPPATVTTEDTQKPKPGDAAASAQLSPAMLVGRWGDNGDCTKDIVINADGTFRSYTGGGGRWTLDGDRMTMTGANGPYEVGVDVINGNTLRVRNPDGSVGTSQRC